MSVPDGQSLRKAPLGIKPVKQISIMDIELLVSILSAKEPVPLIKENEEYIFSLVPELKKCKGFEQNNRWHIYDVYGHILKVVELVPQNLTARFVALFHDVGKPEVYREDENGVGHFYGHWEKSVEVFDRFSKEHGLDADFSKAVSKLIFYHDINFGSMSGDELDKTVNIFTSEELKLLFDIKRADLLAQNPEFHGLLKDYDIQEKTVLNIKTKISK